MTDQATIPTRDEVFEVEAKYWGLWKARNKREAFVRECAAASQPLSDEDVRRRDLVVAQREQLAQELAAAEQEMIRVIRLAGGSAMRGTL